MNKEYLNVDLKKIIEENYRVFTNDGGFYNDEYIKSLIHEASIFLDKEYPGWLLKIDLAKLDIKNCRNCIIGQIDDYGYGYIEDYSSVFDKILLNYKDGLISRFRLAFGFGVTNGFFVLQSEWVKLIKKKRKEYTEKHRKLKRKPKRIKA